MQVIKAGYEIMDPINGEEVLKKIEKVARVCYKSEDKIGEGTAERMVRALIKGGHLAMLEHGQVILSLDNSTYEIVRWMLSHIRERCGEMPMLRCTSLKYSQRNIISGNMRAWLEFLEICCSYEIGVISVIFDKLSAMRYIPIFDDIKAKVDATPDLLYKVGDGWAYELFYDDLTYKERLVHYDLTVKFIVDRGVSHEIVRHRVASFAQESTRYCNYGSKGGEITVIEPFYLNVDGVTVSPDNWSERYGAWARACEKAEQSYLKMLADGATPQEARAVLPNSLKTEVVMTANLREWRHFFKLRAVGVTGKPHPQMVEVALPLLKDLQEKIPVVFEDLEVE